VSSRARDQLRRGPHIALNFSVLFIEIGGAKGLVNLFGVVHEMEMVSSLERHHELRRRCALKNFQHSLQRQKRVIFCDQKLQRCAANQSSVKRAICFSCAERPPRRQCHDGLDAQLRIWRGKHRPSAKARGNSVCVTGCRAHLNIKQETSRADGAGGFLPRARPLL